MKVRGVKGMGGGEGKECEVEGGKIRIGGGWMRGIEQGEVELQDYMKILLN